MKPLLSRSPHPKDSAHSSRPPPYNLPDWPTPFIGRRELVEEVSTYLLKKEVRLLTLIGPPGIGKTRLSSEVAMQVLDQFPDGAYMVRLSPVSLSEQVLPIIARELGVKEVSNRPALDVLKDYLREKRMLLVLDNFEQVVAAGKQVAQLVQECPGLEVLVSSRAPLHVYGEYEFDMPSMSMPDPGGPATLEAIAKHEAVELFVLRSQAVNHRFALTEENATTVAEICRQLDGLPLAIELAAARIKVLTPRQLLPRLTNRLKLLTTGARDLPARQQTLRGAIDWSYELLEPAEKSLFARMSVFVGPGTLEAVEAICALPGEGDFDAESDIESLLDKSLLRHYDRGEDPGFWMLWTIREYAHERLEASGEAEPIKRQHAAYYLALAEQAEPKLTSGQRGSWLERLDGEIHNLRAALDWCLSNGGDHEMGLRLAGALHWYWYFRGYFNEGRERLDRALALAAPTQVTAARANALYAAGRLALYQDDFEVMRSSLEESARIWREVGDKKYLAYTLANLGMGIVFRTRDPDAGGQILIEQAVSLFREIGDKWGLAFALDLTEDAANLLAGAEQQIELCLEESLALYRELGDEWGVALDLTKLGHLFLRRGDYETARSRLEEALSMQRTVVDRWNTAHIVLSLGLVEWQQGDHERARTCYEESLTHFRELGDRLRMSFPMRNLGHIAQEQGDYERAKALYEESLALAYELRNVPNAALCLAALGGVASVRQQHIRAAVLLGVAGALRESSHGMMPAGDLSLFNRNLAAVRSSLDANLFTQAWDWGRTLSLDQAVAYANGMWSPLELGPGAR